MSSPASSAEAPPAAAGRFQAFCALVRLELEPFQRELAEVFSGRRETLILLPRGNGKSTLFAALALWHSYDAAAAIYVAAASRDQAAVLFDIARGMAAAHPDLERRITATRRELRTADGFVKVISSDAPKQHGGERALHALRRDRAGGGRRPGRAEARRARAAPARARSRAEADGARETRVSIRGRPRVVHGAPDPRLQGSALSYCSCAASCEPLVASPAL